MINRVIVLVIDGLGVGALSDAAEYDDVGSNTLSHLADAVGGLNLPTLEALGLGLLFFSFSNESAAAFFSWFNILCSVSKLIERFLFSSFTISFFRLL